MNKFVFISHSSLDRIYADYVLNFLENNNKIKCWICYRDINGGSNYNDALKEAIENSQCVVLLCSANSIKSTGVQNEIELATSLNKPIIPCKIDNIEDFGSLSYHLQAKHWLELRSSDIQADLTVLTKSIFKLIGNPIFNLLKQIDSTFLSITNGFTEELIQELVNELDAVTKFELLEKRNEFKTLYKQLCDELTTVIKKYNGDIAHHHDNLMNIMNKTWDLVREVLDK